MHIFNVATIFIVLSLTSATLSILDFMHQADFSEPSLVTRRHRGDPFAKHTIIFRDAARRALFFKSNGHQLPCIGSTATVQPIFTRLFSSRSHVSRGLKYSIMADASARSSPAMD